MTITYELLKLFNTKVARYKGMDINIFGLPIFKDKDSRSIKNAYYSLSSKGYFSDCDEGIILSQKGKKYLKEKYLTENVFDSPFSDNDPKNLLVLYDIPESKKLERDWFRRHLRKFGYEMIQQSVWVGPSPLPKEFLKHVSKIGIKDSLKKFKLEKAYSPRQEF